MNWKEVRDWVEDDKHISELIVTKLPKNMMKVYKSNRKRVKIDGTKFKH